MPPDRCGDDPRDAGDDDRRDSDLCIGSLYTVFIAGHVLDLEGMVVRFPNPSIIHIPACIRKPCPSGKRKVGLGLLLGAAKCRGVM